MVRHPAYRRKKYESKIDGDVVKQRFAAMKETMQEQVDAAFTELASLEDSVKTEILEPEGIPSVFIPAYLNVARQIWKLTKRFTGKTLEVEAHIVANKWYERGLKPDILNAILAKFGIAEKTFPATG